MKQITPIVLILSAVLLVASCQQRDKQGRVLDTPTTGSIRVMIDESYQPFVASAIDVFDSVYRQAHIDPIYAAEGEVINALLKDSVQVAVIARLLTEDELKFFRQRGFTPKTTPIAHDAIAFILHPSNPDSLLTQEQVRALVSGDYTSWKQVNPRSPLGTVQLVFDNGLSGTVQYAKDSIAGGKLTAQASALKRNEEVIDYVAGHPNAVGIMGANWISDTDDKGVQRFRSTIRLADIAKAPGERGYGPYQAYLSTGTYPYRRTVYVINAQARSGLGLGFASYLAGPGGQRIIHKDGLLAAQSPTRLIEVSR